ncbi:SWIM zinc finger family protein [Streptacidiphilus sp. PAMC 29251]
MAAVGRSTAARSTAGRAAAGKATAANGLRRTFPPLPPRSGPGSRGAFAVSWWGNAWVAALEDGYGTDGRLSRGRSYARGGYVGEITVSPGRIQARVQGSRRTPYQTAVTVPQFSAVEWDRLLDLAADQAGRIAALLDREMPPELAEDAERAGVPLFPSRQQLEPSCTCPDWGYPCKHAAAVYYQVGRLLDEDPFVLLLVRGRGERELMEELQRRNTARAAAEGLGTGRDPDQGPAAAARGVPARAVFAGRAGLPPLPAPPEPVDRPGPVPVLRGGAEPAPGLDPGALEQLAADASVRAVRLLADALSADHAERLPPAPLTARQDAIRLAAVRSSDTELFQRVLLALGTTPPELARAVRAWRHGGAAGLDVLDAEWTPDPAVIARAKAAMAAAWEGQRPPPLRAARNRLTAVGRDAQLRLGRDGRWYPYRREQGVWWPAGPADQDPAAALAALLEAPPTGRQSPGST